MARVKLFSVSIALILSACATIEERIVDRVAVNSEETTTASSPEDKAALLGIEAEEFVGQSPGRLEIILGEADFVRQEGIGEFRRYDTPNCRIYALISSETGGRPIIQTISVGAVSNSDTAPELAECERKG